MEIANGQGTQALSMDGLVAATVDLVSLPKVYFEVQRILDNPEGTVIELARAIALDPALTARLLRIVNSPIFAQAKPVVTVSRAVDILGMRQIHNLVLVASLYASFSRFDAYSEDMTQFWRGSVHRAVLTRALAAHAGVRDTERLFILGLLSDLGLLVLRMHGAARLAAAMGLAELNQGPLHEAEGQVMGFDHGQLGGALLAAWKLPDSLHGPIAAQSLSELPQSDAREAALLHVAGRMVEALERGQPPFTWVAPLAWELAGMAPELPEGLLAEASDEVGRVHAHFFAG